MGCVGVEGGCEGGGAGGGGEVVGGFGVGVGGGIDAMGIEDREENADVFEPGVHALSVERDHSVSGIADDDDRGGEVVGGAFYGDEGEVGGGCELGDEIFWGDESGCYTWEVGVEELREEGRGVCG